MTTPKRSDSPIGQPGSVQDSGDTDIDVIALDVDRPPSSLIKDPDSDSEHHIHIHHPLSPSVLALLIPGSIFGLLARLGLQALATYDGRSIFPLAYAQAVGCLIMGIGLELKEPFGRFYPPLYTALTTGFCGSLTTFSGWQVDVFNSWMNEGHYHRGGLRDAVDGVSKTAFTFALSLASLHFGRHLVNVARPHCFALSPPTRHVRIALTTVSLFSYAAVFPAYIFLPTDYRHQATAALLFAFPGTLMRYLLSIWLNHRLKTIPLGTFTANSFGTALLGIFRVLQSTPIPASPNACAILQGLSDGYCGCLTTISTFAAELDTLGKRKAWIYGAVSWASGQLLLLVIFGSSYFPGHVQKEVTCRFV